ncbi:MAG: hypothetical protein IM496_19055 [Microcystis sp. M049S2]|uniref:DUF6391 domain-containing protein n=1 Tax=Microcystis TaxID=1125 RepID=UPI000CAFF0B0|nr:MULTISPECIES: DUF6391 domain-containing protein [Microcystis]MCA2660513.1 hypothetical protein [Microcystis sp. M049S2]MCA2717243.1 hypothetical protein [Microcystis sp. M169S2]WNF16273.1 DUF6391 domain-containing protein [Microcystis aeruginosa NRERC-214]GBE76086.1 hypothetical protein myaer87_33130 [Microcystis aeruginosa NIES-87]
MTSSSPSNPSFDWFNPSPQQDSDLLAQIGFIPGVKEFLTLRQVHALEHATVWVLSEMAARRQSPFDHSPADNEALGGLSTDRGFYLYGQINTNELQIAAKQALHRLKNGEGQLALHPRCGTNLSVTLALTAGLVLGTHLVFPRGPISQLLGLGLATATAFQIGPDVGMSAQKYLTTAIPFNLTIVNIAPKADLWGRSGHFVQTEWQDLQ